jgi:hypothetical protein
VDDRSWFTTTSVCTNFSPSLLFCKNEAEMTKWETDRKDRRKRHGRRGESRRGGEGKGKEDKERMATVAVEQFRTRPVRRSDKRDKK